MEWGMKRYIITLEKYLQRYVPSLPQNACCAQPRSTVTGVVFYALLIQLISTREIALKGDKKMIERKMYEKVK